MRHPYEKFVRIEMFTMVLAVIFGLLSLIRGLVFLALASLLLLSISFIGTAMLEQVTFQQTKAIKNLIRASVLVILTIYILIQL